MWKFQDRLYAIHSSPITSHMVTKHGKGPDFMLKSTDLTLKMGLENAEQYANNYYQRSAEIEAPFLFGLAFSERCRSAKEQLCDSR